jgi:hypothetical protein
LTVIVFAAVLKEYRRSGTPVRYYASPDEVPEGWKLCTPPEVDIADIMSINRCTKEQALRMMNS